MLNDCGAKAVVAHANLLPEVGPAIPPEVPLFVVPTPPDPTGSPTSFAARRLAHRSGKISAAEVVAFLLGRLADFKVPRMIKFEAALPREDSGKIIKRKLREPYWRRRGGVFRAA